MEKVLTIEDTFYIIGLPGVTVAARKGPRLELSIGDSVILVRPDGTETKARVDHIPMFSPPNLEVKALTFGGLTKEDVPVGTIIYKTKDSYITG